MESLLSELLLSFLVAFCHACPRIRHVSLRILCIIPDAAAAASSPLPRWLKTPTVVFVVSVGGGFVSVRSLFGRFLIFFVCLRRLKRRQRQDRLRSGGQSPSSRRIGKRNQPVITERISESLRLQLRSVHHPAEVRRLRRRSSRCREVAVKSSVEGIFCLQALR